MRLRLVLPIAVALLLPMVLLLSFRPGEGSYRFYQPSGYVAEVNRLIAANKLVYDCASEEIRPQNLNSGEEYFLRKSYLADDLARWRAGDRSRFVVRREPRPDLRAGCSGELERVSETAHRQGLFAYRPPAWSGRLFVRQGSASVSLKGGERRIELARPPWSRQRQNRSAETFEDVWMNRSEDVRSERLALKHLEQGRWFASLEQVGDQAAIEIETPRPSVELNGCLVEQGWRLRLEDGDWLRFQHDRRPALNQRYQVEAGSEAGLISFVNRVDGEVRRRTYGRRLHLAEDLTRAVDTAVRRGEGQGGDSAFDVHLTFDAFFQDLLSQRLGGFCRQRYGRRPLRAGITLLDADSGRILALASYPAPGEPKGLRLKAEQHEPLLERNHNLLQHAVGSAAKPFLAAAALSARPELRTLRLPCFNAPEAPEDFLGYDFGEYNLPGDCGSDDGSVAFRDFLQRSSNRYMLALGMLALSDWSEGGPLVDGRAPELAPRDHFVLGGRTYTRRPRLSVVKDESRPGATELADLEGPAFFQRFRDLFGHQIHYQAGSFTEALALDGWRPILEAAGAAGDRVADQAFGPVSAERVNLRVNLIQQLRQDLYTTLLGLGDNRWSNLLLAESTARLITGKAVDAQWLERVETPPAEGEELPPRVYWDLEAKLAESPVPDLTLAPEDRRLLLAGMTDVIRRVGGTAHETLGPVVEEINGRAPAGVSYRVVAKTGTPSTDLATVERGPTRHAAEAVEIYSGRRQVKSGVLVLGITRIEGEERHSLALSFYIEGQGGSEEATALAADVLIPLVEAYWPEDWLSGPGTTAF